MNNVIDLMEYREALNPHKTGNARCLQCKHEWIETAPIGTVSLECPECHSFQGIFKGLMSTEFSQWVCLCGEFTFFIDSKGAYCAHCGKRPRDLVWIDDGGPDDAA